MSEYVSMGAFRHANANDAKLLARTGEDPEAFGVFYDRFERGVLGYFFRATGRADLAADLTAETFAAALESVGTFNPELRPPEGTRPLLTKGMPTTIAA